MGFKQLFGLYAYLTSLSNYILADGLMPQNSPLGTNFLFPSEKRVVS